MRLALSWAGIFFHEFAGPILYKNGRERYPGLLCWAPACSPNPKNNPEIPNPEPEQPYYPASWTCLHCILTALGARHKGETDFR